MKCEYPTNLSYFFKSMCCIKICLHFASHCKRDLQKVWTWIFNSMQAPLHVKTSWWDKSYNYTCIYLRNFDKVKRTNFIVCTGKHVDVRNLVPKSKVKKTLPLNQLVCVLNEIVAWREGRIESLFSLNDWFDNPLPPLRTITFLLVDENIFHEIGCGNYQSYQFVFSR